jgi:alcohol dehydrogenase (cytochrome c)
MLNPRSRSRFIWIAIFVVGLGLVVTVVSVRFLRVGVQVAWLKATGAIPDVSWVDLLRMGRPGSHFNVPELVDNPNPYATIANPYSTPADVTAGGALFRSYCAICHGSNGTGGNGGPSLQDRKMVQGDSDWALFRTITFGIRGSAMPSSSLPWLDKWRLAAYVRSVTLQNKLVASSVAPIQAKPVDYEQIRGADPGGWLTYSGSYDGHRFSRANQITPANAADLRLMWMRQYNTTEPSIETSPLVVGDTMFVTLPPNRVEALDMKSGALIWSYDRDLPTHVNVCCGFVNRGLAVLGKTLFLGTLDAHLVALNIDTGKVSWDVAIADYSEGYSITGAPLAVKNLVITGVAGGEFGIRGFVVARDASTGKEVWRFDTIPKPGQPGAETWEGNSSSIGGSPTWQIGSFDPETNLIYWPTGNPSPEFDGTSRNGDNLYSNSVVALNADNGALQWYFQFTPHDVFDWDATEILVLLDQTVEGKRQRFLAQANRNGFFYMLDAKTGAFHLAKPFVRQTWADDFDEKGRPQLNSDARPTQKGTTIFPGVGGGTNWESPSYSPMTGLMYIPALDWGGVFYEEHSSRRQGEMFLGGSFQKFANDSSQGAVRALKPLTGEVQWEYRNPATNIGGLLSTAGGVVFGSQDQTFFALDAKTGRELWRVHTGGRTVAAPITFLYHGRQMVTIAAGHDILTFGL